MQASPEVHIPPENWALGGCIATFRAHHWSLSWSNIVDLILGKHLVVSRRWFDEPPTRLREKLLNIPTARRSLAILIDVIYRFHGEAQGAKFNRWGDKTPLNINHMRVIMEVFPRAKFIHLIRDGVDVAHSWSKLDQYHDDVITPARRWRDSVKAASDFKHDHPGRLLEISYEDLCWDPRGRMTEVCEFVNIPFEGELISRTDHYDEMESARSLPHYEKVFSSISTDSIGKGRRQMSARDRCRIASLLNDELVRCGYDPVEID
jgi:hypothetical protein